MISAIAYAIRKNRFVDINEMHIVWRPLTNVGHLINSSQIAFSNESQVFLIAGDLWSGKPNDNIRKRMCLTPFTKVEPLAFI